jgi:hypothetical protein
VEERNENSEKAKKNFESNAKKNHSVSFRNTISYMDGFPLSKGPKEENKTYPKKDLTYKKKIIKNNKLNESKDSGSISTNNNPLNTNRSLNIDYESSNKPTSAEQLTQASEDKNIKNPFDEKPIITLNNANLKTAPNSKNNTDEKRIENEKKAPLLNNDTKNLKKNFSDRKMEKTKSLKTSYIKTDKPYTAYSSNKPNQKVINL